MQVFVISLAQREDRRRHIRQHLAERGVAFDFADAVDGRALADADRARLYDPALARQRGERRTLTPGELGCSLSHLALYRRMLEQDLPAICVLEDDAELSPDFAEVLAALAPALKADATPRVVLLNRRAKRYSAWGAAALAAGRRRCRAVEAQGTDGYVLNRAAAQSLLQTLSPVWTVADCWDWLLARHTLRIDCVVPYVVSCRDDLVSDIDADRRDRGKLAPGPLARLSDFLYSRFVYRLLIRPLYRIGKQR
ncbi:glycosyltransferase family 25 protein [Chitiniphilus purpureus]|uniref:Glycosyltransferase family 25 protein n=1 Tax=Chitiniphilus purpureus TaxID=2981137 RepID=A0ABY6DQ09_9NEIS|nr:glycosyltransferase family 25 protein [Chitiniphilus sp. CD1]UXY15566.1 glycosyltransferase family 25 protein [Chitiniphilus sp. CD1]